MKMLRLMRIQRTIIMMANGSSTTAVLTIPYDRGSDGITSISGSFLAITSTPMADARRVLKPRRRLGMTWLGRGRCCLGGIFRMKKLDEF